MTKINEVKVALDNIFNISINNIKDDEIKKAILINYKVINKYLNSLNNKKKE